MRVDDLTVRRVVAAHLPEAAGNSIVLLGEGTDHVVYLVDEQLVVRFTKEADTAVRAATVERDARLLAAVKATSPLPVPAPVLVAPGDGCLAYLRLPGIPLLDLPPERRMSHGAAIGTELGRLLGALHSAPADRMAGLVDRDEVPLGEWRDEAAEHYAAVAGEIPRAHRRAVETFLVAPPPRAASHLVFTHNDLGIEHVLVDPATVTVTGIIDWTDAALADGARDLGLLRRDLGPAALDAALRAHHASPADATALRTRALFYARCAVLEDLAYGLEMGDARYVDKSVAGLAWLFPA